MTTAKAKTPKKQTEDEILRSAMERVQKEQGGGDDETEHKAAAPTTTKTKKKGAAAQEPETATETVATGKGKMHTVTYVPVEEGDPIFTIFFNMKFTANLPRETNNEELIALAMTNPWFSVDGKPGPKRKKAAPRDDSLDAKSGLPDGLDPNKAEVEVEDVLR